MLSLDFIIFIFKSSDYVCLYVLCLNQVKKKEIFAAFSHKIWYTVGQDQAFSYFAAF